MSETNHKKSVHLKLVESIHDEIEDFAYRTKKRKGAKISKTDIVTVAIDSFLKFDDETKISLLKGARLL